jgi:aryl-alcohol dehydrogenase-like predicted oxidoreductase
MQVSAYCLGTMMFGFVGNGDHEDSVRIIHAALDAGINFVDTADMYSAGESEEIVGKALKGRRDDAILASKCHFQMGEGLNRSGNSRRWILKALEESLQRLQTDWIDLYQIHRPDESTDIEETLSVLTDLVSAGKIRSFGCSTFPAERIVEAHYASERRGLGRFRTEQSPYSILARGLEAAVLPVCEQHRMGVMIWGPLASGFLTGRYRRDTPVDLTTGRAAIQPHRFDPSSAEYATKLDAVERLIQIAETADCTLPQLAMAFPLAHPAVTSVIIGPRTMDQLEHTLAGAEVVLGDPVLDQIDQVVPPGADLYQATWQPPALTDAARRRRPLQDRPAA